ncbi:MAG: hypothetical protein JSV22_07800 [Bacteroidales bacterium]|nr:MAG: hypothetical protein JSV22_07800 [Bacteroidales bacterium]
MLKKIATEFMTKIMQNKTNQTLKLKDGRTLGFAEYGDPLGKPIFEFHGNPSSRLGSGLFDEMAKKMGIHVIGIDRPGMGLSDAKPCPGNSENVNQMSVLGSFPGVRGFLFNTGITTIGLLTGFFANIPGIIIWITLLTTRLTGIEGLIQRLGIFFILIRIEFIAVIILKSLISIVYRK